MKNAVVFAFMSLILLRCGEGDSDKKRLLAEDFPTDYLVFFENDFSLLGGRGPQLNFQDSAIQNYLSRMKKQAGGLISQITPIASTQGKIGFKTSSRSGFLAHLVAGDPQKESSIEEQLKTWQKQGVIGFYHPNHKYTLSANSKNSFTEHDLSWWQEQIRLKKGSKKGLNLKESEKPIIALLDSGVDVDHPSLKGKIWRNPQPGTSNCGLDYYGCHTAGSGFDILGDPDVFPIGVSKMDSACHGRNKSNCQHGTHIAGILVGNGLKNVRGVCPECRVMVLKVISPIEGKGSISDLSVVKALTYLKAQIEAGQNIRVVNLSFGSPVPSQSMQLVIQHLSGMNKGRGPVFVAASGNEDESVESYPAAFPEVIAIAALNSSKTKARYSNYGSWIDLAAPGGEDGESEIFSCAPGRRAVSASGTSMATPVVSGVLGLLAAYYPNFSARDLKEVLFLSADKSKSQGDSAYLGEGVIDVQNAFEVAEDLKLQGRQREVSCGSILGQSEINKEIMGAWRLILLFLVPLAMMFLNIIQSGKKQEKCHYERRPHH